MKLSAGAAADWNGGKTRPNRFIDLEKSHLFVFSKLTRPFLQYITLALEKVGCILHRQHFATNSCLES